MFAEKKYKFFTKKLDLNIFGIRMVVNTNDFDDFIGVAYIGEEGEEVLELWPATTDPGAHWLGDPLNKRGTAILVPGQYRGVYKLDLHCGKYTALCQRAGKVKVYRDNDRDKEHDMDPETVQNGDFGINIHRSNPKSESYRIDKWSAGCQVFKKVAGFHSLINIVRLEEATHGNTTHSYTLFEKKDFSTSKKKKAK